MAWREARLGEKIIQERKKQKGREKKKSVGGVTGGGQGERFVPVLNNDGRVSLSTSPFVLLSFVMYFFLYLCIYFYFCFIHFFVVLSFFLSSFIYLFTSALSLHFCVFFFLFFVIYLFI